VFILVHRDGSVATEQKQEPFLKAIQRTEEYLLFPSDLGLKK
jgi:hypothetical protein